MEDPTPTAPDDTTADGGMGSASPSEDTPKVTASQPGQGDAEPGYHQQTLPLISAAPAAAYTPEAPTITASNPELQPIVTSPVLPAAASSAGPSEELPAAHIQPETTAPSPEPTAAPPRRSLFRKLSPYSHAASWLLLAGVCIAILFWARSFGTRVVQSRPVNARIEIVNPPAWLDRRIVQSLLEEAYQFAGKDTATYDRTRNILDSGILKEFAGLYTGGDTVGGKMIARQSIGYNAWISKVTQVHRAVTQDNGMQSIQITAQWRQPAAWVRADNDGTPMLYLIDAEGTRLPGDYHVSDRPAINPLMVIAGVDMPAAGIPAPGEKWFAKSADGSAPASASHGAAIADDLAAGMQLAATLNRQNFTRQIAAIDLSNFGGRRDARASWINLETVWPSSAGGPRLVEWGRPAGQEKYYEVQAAAKLKTLKDLFNKFGRIDANRDFVDIRTDYVRAPKLASQPQTPPSTRS